MLNCAKVVLSFELKKSKKVFFQSKIIEFKKFSIFAM